MYYDLLAKIKNAGLAEKESFQTPFSKFDFEVAKTLLTSGYLSDVQKRSIGKRNVIEIRLKYQGGKPVVNDFRILSRPSRHMYASYKDLKSVKQGYGVGVISTSKGILSNSVARKEKLGGEYLFQIW